MFAARKGVKSETLGWWAWNLGQASSGRDSRESNVRMLPVTVRGSPTPEVRPTVEFLELTLADVVVRFPAGTDAEYVGAVLLEVRATC